jgi:hypothetical protein
MSIKIIRDIYGKSKAKMSELFIESQCDDMGICKATILLMSQSDVGLYGIQPMGISKL